MTTLTVFAPGVTLTGTICRGELRRTELFVAPVTDTAAVLPAAPSMATETT